MWIYIIDSQYFTAIFTSCLILSVVFGALLAGRKRTVGTFIYNPSEIETSVIVIFPLLLIFTFIESRNLMRDRLDRVTNMKEAIADFRGVSLTTDDSLEFETNQFLTGFVHIMRDLRTNYLRDEHSVKKEIDKLNKNYLTYLYVETQKNSERRNDVFVLIPFLNRLDGTFEKLVESLDDRTPPIIFVSLTITSLLMGVLIGFLNRFNGVRNYLIPLIFLVTVSLCIKRIRDQENPYSGVSQLDFSGFTFQSFPDV